MPTFQITGPDGKKYRVQGESAEGALSAVRKMAGGQVSAAPEDPAMSDLPPGMEFDPATGQYFDPGLRQAGIDRHAENPVIGAAKRTGRIVDAGVRGVADTATFGFADEISGAAGAATGIGGEFGNVSGNIDAQRARDALDAEQVPVARMTGQVAGALATPAGLARKGVTLLRPGQGLGRTAVYGAGEGAAYGALGGAGSTEGGVADRAIGARNGAGFGLVAGGVAPLLIGGATAVGRKGVDAVRNNIGSPAQQAQRRVISAARNAGMDEAAITARFGELGPDGMLVDMLGPQGYALGRSAANTSPEAQSILESATYSRMGGQNDRVVGALESAAGLPAGSRSTVDDLKAAAYAKRAPTISKAYDQARALGADIPVEDFAEIYKSPSGYKAFQDAFKAVRDRSVSGEESAKSRLGVLDLVKRRLDSDAKVAARKGNNELADRLSGMARTVRTKTDEALGGTEYADARKLRQDAYREEEAFDIGAEVGGRRLALDGPTRARAAAEANPEAVRQGYAATKSAELLNRGSTPGAIDAFAPRLQREALDASLGPNAAPVQKQLAAERQYGQTHRALTGNSTTARQLAQMGLTAGAGTGLGLYSGMDLTTAGLTGAALAGARRLGSAGLGALRSANEAAVAPYMARFLTENGLPEGIEGARLVMGDPKLRRALARSLGLGSGTGSGTEAREPIRIDVTRAGGE